MKNEDIADRLAIDDVITAYAVAVDARDWKAMEALFADGAVLDYSAFDGPRGDVAKGVAWVAEALAGFPVSQHLCTNRQILLAPGAERDTATATCAVFNPLADANGRVFLVGGSYHDRFARTATGWRFAERIARPAWSTFPA